MCRIKELKAEQVKELPVGSCVWIRHGRWRKEYIIVEKNGGKFLMNIGSSVLRTIRDRQTFRYEVEDEKTVPRAASQTGTE